MEGVQRLSARRTTSVRFAAVSLKCLKRSGAGALSPKVSMPTTAAQPYYHQPSVTPASMATRGTPAGSTLLL